MLTAGEWAAQQWGPVDLGDRRLNRRAVEIGSRMAAHPEASLPEQMGEPKMLKGAYLLLNHIAIGMEQLLAPHRQEALRQAGQHAVVLMVEDSTELDYTTHRQMTGVARIGDDRGHGLLLHDTLALVPESRTLLGLVHAQVLLRAPKQEKRPKWVRTPEAQVWEVSARAVGRAPADVIYVHVSDGASDIFEYMATCRELDKHFLVRASHNRRLPEALPDPQDYEERIEHLLDYARHLPPAQGSAYTLHLPAEGQRPARQAVLALQWAQMTLTPSEQAPADLRQRAPLRIWLLRAWEPDPPEGAEAVEWILLSSLPILSLADAQRCVDWYSCRWFCEDFHQCLKTGCAVERSQLDDGADIARLLGFAMPVAVRLLQLRQAARNFPEAPASSVIDPLMVQVLAQHRHTDWQTITTAAFWQAVAQLGGHQGRTRDGPPGWRTVWRGWRRLSDWTDGARLFANLAPT